MFGGCVGISIGRMCPRCGRSGEGFVGALCSGCYVEVYGVAVVPESLELPYCRVCGSYRLQGQWIEGSGRLKDTVMEYVYVFLSQRLKPTMFVEEVWVKGVDVLEDVVRDVMSVKVSIAGRSGSIVLNDSKIVRVRVNMVVCPSCTRRLSKTGYGAVIQVRPLVGGLGEDVRVKLERLLSKLEFRVRSSIISIERVRNGFDILVEDQSVARIIAGKVKAAFGGYTIETFKVTGVKQGGGRKGILTIAVRISNVKPGYVVAYSGTPHMVIDSSSHGLKLLNMNTGSLTTISYEDLAGVELLGDREYSLGVLRKLQLSRIEGDNLVFKDLDSGREILASIGGVRVLRGNLILGEVYIAYLLGDKLHLVGGLEYE